MALDAGDARVRPLLVGDELRLHRRMTHLSTETDGIHVLDALVRTERDDHDVGHREAEDDRPPTVRCAGSLRSMRGQSTEAGGLPAARRRRSTQAPRGMSRSPSTNNAGRRRKKTMPRYGLRVKAEQVAKQDDDEHDGADRREHHARDRDRAPDQPNVAGHVAYYFFSVER